MHSLFSLKTNSCTGIAYCECGKVCKSAVGLKRHEKFTVKALQSLLLKVFMHVEPVPMSASL